MEPENKKEKKNEGFRKGFLAGLLTAAVLLTGAFGIRYMTGLTGGFRTNVVPPETKLRRMKFPRRPIT